MTQREIRSKCFICGIARNRFDAESTGFRHHCTHEHNVWQVVFIPVYQRLYISHIPCTQRDVSVCVHELTRTSR